MLTRIAKSALELFAQSFVETHRKGTVPEHNIDAALDAIDARFAYPDCVVVLKGQQKSILSKEVAAIVNNTPIYGNKPSLQKARALLATLSYINHDIVTATATAGAATTSVALSSTSSSTQGSIASRLWSKVSGPGTQTITSPTSATTTVTGLAAGTYTFKILVTDVHGNTDESSVEFTATGV